MMHPVPPFTHVWQHRLHAPDHAVQVDVHDVLVFVERGLFAHAVAADASVVHQHVDVAGGGDDLGHGTVY